MARYILIDSITGYIFGDTADFASGHQSDIRSIAEAARLLGEHIGAGEYTYIEHSSRPSGADGYHVYRADINGSEAVPDILDGQDQETIEAVERDCDYVGFVQCVREAE